MLTVRVVSHKKRREQEGHERSDVVDGGTRTRRGVVAPAQRLLVNLNGFRLRRMGRCVCCRELRVNSTGARTVATQSDNL